MHYLGHLVVKCCTKTALPDDNQRDLTACHLPKQQPLSKSFSNTHRKTQKFALIRHLETGDRQINPHEV
jgi:hypothetical protein